MSSSHSRWELPQMPFPPFLQEQGLGAPTQTQLVGGNVAKSNAKVVSSWLEFNREWCGFIMGRMQQDIALVHRLASCTAPQDVFTVYADFFQNAIEDYQREYTALAKSCDMRIGEAINASKPSSDRR
jgi:hypothetical protein